MYDIITFGSASQDIILKSKAFKVVKDTKDSVTGEGICLSLGSKIDVEDIKFNSGGGGTNTAATFAKQGFKTAFCGVVGDDEVGKELVDELKRLKIDASLVSKTKEKSTNYSVIISSDGQDRTILAYRGAAELLDKNNIPFKKIKARWIYLAPLSGILCNNFKDIIDFAFENKIKIAVNPGSCQLSYPAEELKEILKKVNILFLNQEEASFLTKISFRDEIAIFKKIDEMCPGIAVMTKGIEGVVVSDGKYIYSAKPHKELDIIDSTGAGDAFASGFLSYYIRHDGDIEKAIQLGTANAEACLSEVGAKHGLLDKNSKFDPVKVSKEECGTNNLCIEK